MKPVPTACLISNFPLLYNGLVNENFHKLWSCSCVEIFFCAVYIYLMWHVLKQP